MATIVEASPPPGETGSHADSSARLSAYLEIAEAASLVDLERLLDTYLEDLCRPISWEIVCLVQPDREPVAHLRGPLVSAHTASGQGETLSLPLQAGNNLSGTFQLVLPRSTILSVEVHADLAALTRLLTTTIARLYFELRSVTQMAELYFVRSLVKGETREGIPQALSGSTLTLLQALGVSALGVLIRGPEHDGLAWGISRRLPDVVLSPTAIRELWDMALARIEETACDHLLLRSQELRAMQQVYNLPFLAQLQSLLVVPIGTTGAWQGFVLASEDRKWARQPISAAAIAACAMMARSIARSLTQGELLGEMIERSHLLRMLTDTLDDAVITTREEHVVSWNHGAQRLLGYHQEEVVGRPIHAVLPGLPAELRALDQEVTSGGVKRSAEWKLQTTAGRELWIACTRTTLPQFAPGSSTDMYVLRDVGHERELEYLKDELLSSVSHELKTPLNGIYGFARLLLERPHLPERMRREALESLQASAERLSRMADDFIVAARSHRHQLPLELDYVDMAPITRAAVKELRRRHPTRIIGLRVERNLPQTLADALRIKQIFDNLVGNAIKYSSEGTRVGVNVRKRGEAIAISVSDHGVGIPKAAQTHIFKPFYRADNSRSARASGVGLGLSIVNSLVNAHGGRVTVRSTEGRGSTFTFTLPLPQERTGLTSGPTMSGEEDK